MDNSVAERAAGRIERDGVELHWWLTAGDARSPLVVCTHGGRWITGCGMRKWRGSRRNIES